MQTYQKTLKIFYLQRQYNVCKINVRFRESLLVLGVSAGISNFETVRKLFVFTEHSGYLLRECKRTYFKTPCKGNKNTI